MKFITLTAFVALVSQASAIRYKDSEGPTKVDFGENDDPVLQRADDSTDPDDKKWKKDNPLDWGWDNGDADESVLTMVDGTLRRIY